MSLGSCGMSNIANISATPPYAIAANHNIPDEDEDILFYHSSALDQAGGLVVIRPVEKKRKMIEHYSSDSLVNDWSIPIETDSYEQWTPTMIHRNGKLYCVGIDGYDGADSMAFRFMIVDEKAHKIVSDSRVFRDDREHSTVFHKAHKSPYSESFSPDTNAFLYYRIDVPGDDKKLNIHCQLYDYSGKLIEAPTIAIPLPAIHNGSDDIYMSNYGLLGMTVDNDRNYYVIIRTTFETLTVMKYHAGSFQSPESLSADFSSAKFPPSDYWIKAAYAQFRPHTQILDLAGTHRKVTRSSDMEDILVASFDFNSKNVQTFQYTPQKESLKKLIDQSDLEGFEISNFIFDPGTSRKMIVVENRIGGIVTTSTSSYSPATNHTGNAAFDWGSGSFSDAMDYCKGIICYAFEQDGKPAFQLSLPNRAGHTKSEYALSAPESSKMTVYYTERDTLPAGLYTTDLDITHGTLSSPRSVLQYGGETYILAQETQWENSKSAIMFGMGEKRYHGGWRNGNPSILMVKTQ